MKTWILVLLWLLPFFNTTVAQSLEGRLEVKDSKKAHGLEMTVDTGKIFLVFGKEQKPLVSFQADFSKLPAWFDFTLKDTAGNIKLQSLLHISNDNQILWQLFEGTKPNRIVTGWGEILRRKQ